jgi:hypothetical protein
LVELSSSKESAILITIRPRLTNSLRPLRPALVIGVPLLLLAAVLQVSAADPEIAMTCLFAVFVLSALALYRCLYWRIIIGRRWMQVTSNAMVAMRGRTPVRQIEWTSIAKIEVIRAVGRPEWSRYAQFLEIRVEKRDSGRRLRRWSRFTHLLLIENDRAKELRELREEARRHGVDFVE